MRSVQLAARGLQSPSCAARQTPPWCTLRTLRMLPRRRDVRQLTTCRWGQACLPRALKPSRTPVWPRAILFHPTLSCAAPPVAEGRVYGCRCGLGLGVDACLWRTESSCSPSQLAAPGCPLMCLARCCAGRHICFCRATATGAVHQGGTLAFCPLARSVRGNMQNTGRVTCYAFSAGRQCCA